MTVEERLETLERERRVAVERERQALARIQVLEARQRTRVTPGSALMLGMVLALTALCGSRAYAVGQVPNHFEVAVSVKPGSDSAPIDLPIHDSPVTINCSSFLVNINEDFGTTAFVHLTHHSVADQLSWSGVHGNPDMGARLTVGNTKITDTPIVTVASFNRAELRSHANRGGVLRQIVVHPTLEMGDQVIQVVVEMIW